VAVGVRMYKRVAVDIGIPGIEWVLCENGGVYHAALRPSRGWMRSMSKELSNSCGRPMNQHDTGAGSAEGRLRRKQRAVYASTDW
jgi:hypothetical protein